MTINWHNIRPLDNSQNDGFEELMCQLARNESIPNKKKFIRKGKPDAGVECFWILHNGDEWAWQAKFFTSSLDDSQWGQLDKSVKTVLEKHPNLKKYYIAIPNDPPDARLLGQTSMLEKWDERVKKWDGWASDKGLVVEFLPWWSSDLIARLSQLDNQGLTYFWFNKEEFTDDWFLENTQQSISDLGKRYTPNFYDNLNVDVEISQVFNGISRNKKLKNRIQRSLDCLLISGRKILPNAPTSNDEKARLTVGLDGIANMFNEIEFGGVELIPVESFTSFLNDISDVAREIYDFYLTEEEKLKESKSKSHGRYQKYGPDINTLSELQHALYETRRVIQSDALVLACNPYLILDGDAGMGKSHLLADVITKRNESGACSLFLLGQHFVTEEDPWTQIKKKLDITCSFNEFFGALNAKAEASRRRLVIFIDAINEGKGKYFWAEHIRGFIQKIKNYPWVGLVISVRSSYSELLVPKDLLPTEFISRCTHYGFSDNEYEASKLFFNNFGIELPSIPLLHPEFQNPLFLLLFCEGLSKAGYTRIPDGLQGISDIIGFFVNSVNQRLSMPNKFNYPRNINIVKKAINVIISNKANNGIDFMSYDNAYVELNKLSQNYSIKTGLLDCLISEGVFSKNLFWIADNSEYQEGIYLSYERFEDHMTVKYLLETHANTEKEFQEGGAFYELFKDELSCYQNKGLLEALSIQLPESKGKEFIDLAPYVKGEYPVVESFVQSLLWRKLKFVSEELIEYINSEVSAYTETEELFWETIISVCSNPEHYFNGAFLHRNLFDITLAERDGWWTIYLKDSYIGSNAIKRLIDWAWSNCDKSHISNESKKLSSIGITWLFTSTNRLLRDEATKALVCLLKDNIDVLIELLKEFKGVNDPYVYERLFAVAYGCALTTKVKSKLKELSNYIFDTIFDTEYEEIYPHILLRDYARGVIEYTYYTFGDFGIDIEKARPPYRSKFYKDAPSNAELDAKYETEFDKEKDYLYSQNNILSSMTTEYGRGICHYGDFGRYTFQSALSSWEVDPDKMSNIAVDWIFSKYGYDAELHGRFDRNIGSDNGRTSPNERIGKKYQWIALHEMLARVSDNCLMKSEKGWQDNENEEYNGTWQPYVRDIDPSMPLRKTKELDEDNQTEHWWLEEKHNNWGLSDQDWVNISDDLPNEPNLINVIDEENNEWLVLEGHPEWSEPKLLGKDKWEQPHKRLRYHIKSYLVSEDDDQKFIDWVALQDFIGRWMPESSDRYQVFDQEYYWSPAFEYFNNYYYGGLEHHEITDKGNDNKVCDVILTSCNYSWVKDTDNSIDRSFNILKPSKVIFDGMGLIPTDKVAEFADKNNNIVCYSPSVYNDSKPYLLVKKKAFIEFLQVHKLKVVWTILGEKNIIGGNTHSDEYLGRLEISGAYSLDDGNKLDGLVHTKKT
jgi:hypothetical protein